MQWAYCFCVNSDMGDSLVCASCEVRANFRNMKPCLNSAIDIRDDLINMKDSPAQSEDKYRHLALSSC